MIPDTFDGILLRIVARGEGRFGWHDIATHLSTMDAPRDRHLLDALKALAANGWLSSVEGHWVITQKGERWSALSEAALSLADAFRDVGACVHYVAGRDPTSIASELETLLPFDDLASGVAFASSLLPADLRDAFARRMLDGGAAQRRGIWELWAPMRLERAGTRPIPIEPWEPMLRCGLADPDPQVRELAARMAFDGRLVFPELLALVDDVTTRRTVLLALGHADDPDTLAILLEALHGDDPDDAAWAVRGLALRADGRQAFTAALDDPRPTVRRAAKFAMSDSP